MSRQKTALVTGGARGIGLAISETLARDGYHVLVKYFLSEDEAKDLLARLRETGCAATLLRADVANPRDVREMVAAALLETAGSMSWSNNADWLLGPF